MLTPFLVEVRQRSFFFVAGVVHWMEMLVDSKKAVVFLLMKICQTVV